MEANPALVSKLGIRYDIARVASGNSFWVFVAISSISIRCLGGKEERKISKGCFDVGYLI